MTTRSLLSSPWAITLLAVLTSGGLGMATQQLPSGARWFTAWSTAQNGLGDKTITNVTVRLVARVTIPGEAVRIRLDNTYGTSPVSIGKAFVGWRLQGASIIPGSNRQLLFNKSVSVTIPAAGTVESDSVPLKTVARQDLAVSLYLPGTDVRGSQHGNALVTSYVSVHGSGDMAAEETGKPFPDTIRSMPWLKAVDVLSSTAAGTVVIFGDSITDGACNTIDGYDRWGDWLAVRLQLEGGREIAVVNEGIGGNTLTSGNFAQPAIGEPGPPGIERLDRDVLSHKGLTHVILFMGTNDIRRGAPASQVITGMENIARRVKARDVKIYAVTIIPRHLGSGPGWTPENTQFRKEVNAWLRGKSPFDAVIDFDQAVRDPANPERLNAPFNCDGIHPTLSGYFQMARSVPLDLFISRGRR